MLRSATMVSFCGRATLLFTRPSVGGWGSGRTFPIGPTIDSDRSVVTFLWASDPPYCRAMWSPISTYMSINTRTMVDDGSSLGLERMPITTSCCSIASTPALNCATLVRSRQLRRARRRWRRACVRERETVLPMTERAAGSLSQKGRLTRCNSSAGRPSVPWGTSAPPSSRGRLRRLGSPPPRTGQCPPRG